MQSQTLTAAETVTSFKPRSMPKAAAALAILDRDDTELTLVDAICAADHILIAWAASLIGPGVTLDQAIAAMRDAIAATV